MILTPMVVDDDADDKGSDDGSGVADEGVAAMEMLTAVNVGSNDSGADTAMYGQDGGADLGHDDDNSHWERMRPLVEKIFVVYQRLC